MSRWSTLDGGPPQIIAHRGASGRFPEHVLPGYLQALDDGADIIEPDLIPSRDGVLFCRHDLGLRRSTDIASRPGLADRESNGDWSCLALDAAEIDQIGCVQPFAARDQTLNGVFHPPRFAALLEWAGQQARERGRPVVIYPELKHPVEAAAQGIDAVGCLLAELQRHLPPQVQVLLQCFDIDALRRLADATGFPAALLIDSRSDPYAALDRHGEWLSGLALSKRWLQRGQGRALIAAIHARGLRVDAWTFRDDDIAPGFDSIAAELTQAMELGVDRLFCDFPATATRLRAQLQDVQG